MSDPVVEPRRWRADTRFLWPDLRRPGMAMRTKPDASAPETPSDPAALCERIERELAGEAWRYRHVLLVGLVTLVMPWVLLAIMWAGFWVLPYSIVWEPFERGFYLPGYSLFEASAYVLLFAFLAWGWVYTRDSVHALRRLGVDYRRLRDADDASRVEYAAEAASGSWPRVRALLMRGRGFEAYRQALESRPSA